MRILLITEALVLGGAETFVLRLARRLAQDGHQAEVLCLNPDFEDPRLVAYYGDLVIHRIPRFGLRTLKRADRVAGWLKLDPMLQQRRARRWVERRLVGRFDIYHSHLFGADWLMTLLKQRHPAIRIVSTLHGDYALLESRQKGTERARIRNWPAKLAQTLAAVDRWVTISPAQHRQFVDDFGVDPARLVGIPNGYAPPAPLPAPPNRDRSGTRFVMVARGMREKGWGFLVDAFFRLEGDCSLLLVGEGGFLDQLRERHGDHPRITFAGAHPNPVALIATADAFVHPSIYRAESMPTVIIEALFAGLPVIATRIGSVAAMVAAPSGERAGMLVERDEATLTDQLTAAMQSYLDDPALRRRHAALAPAAFARFDMGRCAAAYAQLYAEVAGDVPITSATAARH
jgi:glycosyltransferase involved in cell wall biosynthesis